MQPPDLSVVIPALDEGGNIGALVTGLRAQLERLRLQHEVIVVDGHSTDGTRAAAEAAGAAVVIQPARGYADALRSGLLAARGEYILTMDADHSHAPEVVGALWEQRSAGDVVIASRYVAGGAATMAPSRRFLSRALNRVARTVLRIPVRDLSSGFRLYRRAALRLDDLRAGHFDVLIELLVRLHAEGWRVAEVPFRYRARASGRSHVVYLRFARAYASTLARLWRLRNTVASADYDDRAFDSRIPIQRYWQRRRFAIVLAMLGPARRVLDVGCGSSRILRALPRAVGVDLEMRPLRFRRRTNRWLVNADAAALPVRTAGFDGVVCSEVIEHISHDGRVFDELARVIVPGGTLVIGTPDYGQWQWRWIEWWYKRLLPGAHGHFHVTQYTRSSLEHHLTRAGFEVLEARTICRAELILKCRRR
jgi:dolichol-phosphate mannosyltransferase